MPITSAGQEKRTEEAFKTSQKYALDAGKTPAGCTGMDAIGRKFKIARDVAPPGGEHVVRELKKEPGVANPFAVAWSMKNKGEI
ncbi:MAG: hypothetical protein ABSE84_01585 [Isosphaeraceae bacterium]|jgi:hypothetical protein